MSGLDWHPTKWEHLRLQEWGLHSYLCVRDCGWLCGVWPRGGDSARNWSERQRFTWPHIAARSVERWHRDVCENSSCLKIPRQKLRYKHFTAPQTERNPRKLAERPDQPQSLHSVHSGMEAIPHYQSLADDIKTQLTSQWNGWLFHRLYRRKTSKETHFINHRHRSKWLWLDRPDGVIRANEEGVYGPSLVEREEAKGQHPWDWTESQPHDEHFEKNKEQRTGQIWSTPGLPHDQEPRAVI